MDDKDITSDILEDRHKIYGVFAEMADTAQALKKALNLRAAVRVEPDQKEALELIATKMARIVTGDPNYIDSWDDIAGYARLVADRLRGVVR